MVVHGLEHERVIAHAQHGQVLALVHDEAGDADLAAGLDGLDHELVALVPALARGQIVRSVEIHRVHVLEIDELLDLDGVPLLGLEPGELLLLDDDVLIGRDLEAARGLAEVVLFARVRAVELATQPAGAVRGHHVKVHLAIAHHRVELDRNIHETERDRATPE